MHPASLRQHLEEVFEVSSLYLEIGKQTDCYFLRQKDPKAFWNLVWWFTSFQLPYEFLVPYDECYS